MVTRRLDPSQRMEIERLLDERGFEWEFVKGMSLDEFNVDKSLKNQARLGNPLKPTVVERYKSAMAAGSDFPAVVAATQAQGGHLMVDGNHRYHAHQGKRGIDTYLIIDGDPQAITLLTFELNTTHGEATSEEERIHQGLWMIDNGMTAEEAARRLSVRPSALRSANSAHQAELRAQMVGIETKEWERLPSATRARLNSISTDEGFAGLTKVAVQAKLSTPEVSEAVRNMTDLRSSQKQAEYVEAVRETYSDRLQRAGMGNGDKRGRRGMGPRQRINLALTQWLSMPEEAIASVKLYTPDEKQAARTKVRQVIERAEQLEKALAE